MPRARTPQDKAEVTGRTEINAGRFKDRSKPKARKLGNPYKLMSDVETAYWLEVSDEIPWLVSTDRQSLRQLCCLLAETDAIRAQGEIVPQALRTQIRMYLNSFGGTPSDRTRIEAPQEDDDDPADQYLQ